MTSHSSRDSTAPEPREDPVWSTLESAARDRGSLDDYVVELYAEMRRIARRQLRGEQTGHTLSTTALVHEAYLKLSRLDRLEWQSRAHFCAEAARAMRRILVDHAVRRKAGKRGGDWYRVELEDDLVGGAPEDERFLALNQALEELATARPRLARVVECRFFGGMTVPEIGEALDLSPATVKRDWQLARAWLNRELGPESRRDGVADSPAGD